MMALLLLVLQLLSLLRLAAGASIISMPNCSDHCGHVKIPYPFGMGAHCYRNPSYEIICNASLTSPKPFLRQFDLEVLDINWSRRHSPSAPPASYDSTAIILRVAMSPPNLCGIKGGKKIRSTDLKGSPYRFSTKYNVLKMEGCGDSAILRERNGDIMAGCASICDGVAVNGRGKTCYGVGCCQSSVAQSTTDEYLYKLHNYENWYTGLDYYEIDVGFQQEINKYSCNASVALVDIDFMDVHPNTFPIATALEWHATWVTDIPLSAKVVNVSCKDFKCNCGPYYEGNPYLPNGCQVVEECHKCKSSCGNSYDFNSGRNTYFCKKHLILRQASFLGFIIGIGALLVVLGTCWLYNYVKIRREIKRKAKHFKRNGGLLLQQQMSCDEGVVETTKIFSVTELEKATNNFNENRILGKGGQGTVYKGMLIDGKIVAIKKATKVDESQIEQFVNEVVILSQVNHRNVVKLLGCCLETEVPILVYEFISNGTLYEHIHGDSEDFHVTWKMRLQIAAESAGAVAYLHSSSSAPVYHRDIKSTNILLDEKFRAKVSDFGTSKAITIEQTHVTTAVMGTYGYMDPEYFQSNQFTEKSDVYSFGVVIVELITGKKPICPTGNGGWINLAAEFLTQMEDSLLLSMVDPRVIDEGKEHEFIAVAELAKKCLNMNGKQRPTMKEISVQLDGIRQSHVPILKEPSPENSDQVVTQVIYSDGGPLSQVMFSSDDDPKDFSVEVQPFMAST